LLSWYHLHSPMLRSIDLTRTGPPRGSRYALQSRGASGAGLLSRLAISSGSIRFFFTGCAYELFTSRPLSACRRSRYSSLHSFSLCNCGFCMFCFMTIRFGPTKKPFILLGRTKSVIYSCGTTFIRRCLTASASVGMGHRNGPLPACPITEASGAGLLSRLAISSGSFGFFFAVCVLWAFHQPPTLCKPRELLLVPSKLLSLCFYCQKIYHALTFFVKPFCSRFLTVGMLQIFLLPLS